MPILYEPILYKPIKFQNEQPKRMGWLRTLLLTVGAGLGVVTTAAIIHMAKGGRPREGVRGWPRTLLLAGGACAGTILTAGGIHFVRQAAMKGELQSFKVGKRGWTDWVEEI